MSPQNPFFHRGPISDPNYFFGRTTELRQLSELLNAGQHLAVYGQRRTGKTSLLFQLKKYAAPEWQVAYIDSGILDGLDDEWFYGAVDRALGGEAEAVTYPHFVNRLRELAQTKQRLILLLDEFELLGANPRLGNTFFNRLRGLAAQYPLQFVTASRAPLLQIAFAQPDTLSSPFFNIFAPMPLPLMNESEAQELLATLSEQAGKKFAARAIDFILQLVGTHPLFVQVAGYRVFAATATADMTGEEESKVRAAIESDLIQHLQYYWSHLSDEARYALITLPLGASAALKEFLQAEGWLGMGDVGRRFVTQQKVEGVRWAGEFLLDARRGLAYAREKVLRLTPTEFALLRLFIEHAGEVLSPEFIEKSLWPSEVSPDNERARDAVKKLRAALGEAGEALVNRRGVGWSLEST